MKDQYQFSLKYEGDSLQTHEMDVRDLAPALIGICDLMDEANRITNDKRARIGVKIQALEGGSFQIDIKLVQDFIDRAIDLLSGKHIEALIALVAIIGFGKSATVGLISLLKKLKGGDYLSAKDLNKDEVELVLASGEKIVASRKTMALYQSKKARKAVSSLTRPLERKGIEALSIIKDGIPVETIKKDEASYFVPAFEETVKTTIRETSLRIQSLWFHGGNKWRFLEGEATIPATISDMKFIERMLKNDESFQPSDELRVKLKETQTIMKDGNVKYEYDIIEVLQHIKH